MNDNTEFDERPMIEILYQMQSDGLIRSYVDDQGDLRWTLTDLGRASQPVRVDDTETTFPPASGGTICTVTPAFEEGSS